MKLIKLGGPSKLHNAKPWKTFHFVMRVLKKGNRNTKHLAYTSLVRPVLEYKSVCWDTCRKRQINEINKKRKKAVQFTNHTKDSDWENLAQRRTIARLCAILNRVVGNGLGKLFATSCEGFAIWVGLKKKKKLGTGSKQRISVSIPL
jgi:hypothetical protein